MKTMNSTRHMQKRMAQRGINGSMVDFVLTHGRADDDRFILDRNDALAVIVDAIDLYKKNRAALLPR